LTVRKVQKNRKQNSDAQPTEAQETGFQRRMGAFFPESGSGFGRRFGEAVRESTEREERLIKHKVSISPTIYGILCVPYLYKSVLCKFFLITFWLYIFLLKEIGAKAAKLLIKCW